MSEASSKLEVWFIDRVKRQGRRIRWGRDGGGDVLPDTFSYSNRDGGEGADYGHHITTPHPHPFGFSNPPTALRDIVQKNAG